MAWHRAADLSAFGTREVIGIEIEGRAIALYRLDGEVLATSGLCTHAGVKLCEGEVVEGYIECPAHAGLFEIRSGKAAGAPVTRDLRVYPVRLEGDAIWIEVGAEGAQIGE